MLADPVPNLHVIGMGILSESGADVRSARKVHRGARAIPQNCSRKASWMILGPPMGPPDVPVDVATADPSVCVICPKFALFISATGFAKFV